MVSEILGTISWAGYAIALGMILYIGIKYMMSAANEKANLKQSVINYLIGAVVLFTATTIFTFCIEFFAEEAGTPTSDTETSTPVDEEPGTSDDGYEEPEEEYTCVKHVWEPVYDDTGDDVDFWRCMNGGCDVIQYSNPFCTGGNHNYSPKYDDSGNSVYYWECNDCGHRTTDKPN